MAKLTPRDYGPLHLITCDDCKRILQIDGITTDIEVNLAQLLIATSTLLAIAHKRGNLAYLLYERLTRFGLIETQKELEVIYSYLFTGGSLASETDLELAALIMGPGEAEDWQFAATVTRFLKRFTYSTPDSPECYAKFKEANRNCWSARQVCKTRWDGDPSQGCARPGTTLILAVKREMQGMLAHWEKPTLYGGFSNGVCAGGVRTRQEKIEYILDRNPFYPGTTFFLGDPHRKRILTEVDPIMIQVPKTMASRRLIAPEPAYRAYRSMALRQSLEDALKKSGTIDYINWDDQSVNRELCRLGSIHGGFATIDLSQASDTISRELFFQVIPEEIRPYLYDAITDTVYIDGAPVRVRCLSTSGNQITWLLEAVYFLAIARVACHWGGEAWAYGDDLVVTAEQYDAVCDLLETFGHTVNRSKSYGQGSYRESCGADYFSGVLVTPCYWPRKIIDLSRSLPEALASLCALQHRVYNHVAARLTLNSVVRALDPHITYSPVGEDCDDLWDAGVDPVESAQQHHRHLVPRFGAGSPSQAFCDWQYMEFLRCGPLYASDEDRAAGISCSRLQKGFYSPVSYRWR